jgi:hypothetical protein
LLIFVAKKGDLERSLKFAVKAIKRRRVRIKLSVNSHSIVTIEVFKRFLKHGFCLRGTFTTLPCGASAFSQSSQVGNTIAYRIADILVSYAFTITYVHELLFLSTYLYCFNAAMLGYTLI